MLFAGREVRIEKNCALGHSFSQYGPPGPSMTLQCKSLYRTVLFYTLLYNVIQYCQKNIFSFLAAADLNDCGFILYSLSLVLLLNIQKYLRGRARSHTSDNTLSCK